MFSTHLPTSPGAIIGYRKTGAPIRLQAGGSEPAPETTPPAAAAEPTAPPAAAPPAEPLATQGTPAQQPQAAASADELPPWAQREFKKLRDENANNRVKAKEAADAAEAKLTTLRQEQEARNLALAKALGFAPDEPLTPEQLQEKLNAEQARTSTAEARARATAVELAVLRAASRLQADGDGLLDSRAFARQIEGLDPTAADFGERVNAAITAAVEAQPRYKLTPAAAGAPPAAPAPQSATTAPPARSSGEHNGSNNGPRQWTQADVDALPKTGEGGRLLNEAIARGELRDLGFNPPRSRR